MLTFLKFCTRLPAPLTAEHSILERKEASIHVLLTDEVILPPVRDSKRKTRDSPLQSSVDVEHVEKGGNRNGNSASKLFFLFALKR